MAWQQIALSEQAAAAWREAYPDGPPPPRAYQDGSRFTALVGREPVAADDMRWHISVRYGDSGLDGRVPTWDELVRAAHELRPGVVFIVGVPPRSWWINTHPDVLHLWEVRDEALVEAWRAERREDGPS
jgi:hypothetical protein